MIYRSHGNVKIHTVAQIHTGVLSIPFIPYTPKSHPLELVLVVRSCKALPALNYANIVILHHLKQEVLEVDVDLPSLRGK